MKEQGGVSISQPFVQIQKVSVEHTPGTGVRSRNLQKNGLLYVFVAGIPQNITVIWGGFSGDGCGIRTKKAI